MKNSKIGGRTPNASHNCSDEKQHPKELQVIQTEDQELLKTEPIELKGKIKTPEKDVSSMFDKYKYNQPSHDGNRS